MRFYQKLILLLAAIALFACNKTTKEITTTQQKQLIDSDTPDIERVKRIESYSQFYKRFHSDSVFQMSRIKFPIEGYYTDEDGNETKWTRDSWIIHRSYIANADTSIYTLQLSDSKSRHEELLFIEGGGFKVERKFKVINGKWYLVYYVDENL